MAAVNPNVSPSSLKESVPLPESMTILTPMKDKIRALKKDDLIFSLRKKKLIRVTKIGAVLAMSVA